jgi:hypothetical protein
MFQQSNQHVDSYYAHSCADRLVDRAALEGVQDTDVLVTDAGLSGLHTALRLALAGKRVTMLEAAGWRGRLRDVMAVRPFSVGRATCRRWRQRWVMNERDACGTACAGRRGSCAHYRHGTISSVIIGPVISGPRDAATGQSAHRVAA